MNDFQTFYDIGACAVSGGNIYAPAPSTGMVVYYLPIFAVLMSVFSFLPFPLAATLWTAGKILILASILKRICSMRIEPLVGSSNSTCYNWKHVGIAVAAVGANISADIALGQINTFIAVGFLFIWLQSKKYSIRGTHLSSLVFAVISSKITPLALIPVLLLTRNFRLAFWMATYTITLNILAAALLGMPIMELFAALSEAASANKLTGAELINPKNQALVAIVGRIYFTYIEEALPTSFAPICSVLGLGIAGLLLLRDYKRPRLAGQPQLTLRDMSLGIVLSLILSPDTRTAHLVQLLAPTLLLAGWSYTQLSSVSRTILKNMKNLTYERSAGLLLAVLMIVIGTAGTALIGVEGLAFVRSHSIQGLVIICLAGILLWAPHSTSLEQRTSKTKQYKQHQSRTLQNFISRQSCSEPPAAEPTRQSSIVFGQANIGLGVKLSINNFLRTKDLGGNSKDGPKI